MDPALEDARQRAEVYAASRGRRFAELLGWGYDGIVLQTTSSTAVKALKHALLFQRERDAYVRLADAGVSQVREFSVPKLIDFDNDLWVVEMTIVSPPCVLDFAGAMLDRNPFLDFTEEQYAEWEAEKRDEFEDRWETVGMVMAALRRHGVYLTDVRPSNIKFPADDEDLPPSPPPC
ncbi:MAG: hypothetical protein KY476_17565 [Planctomycetes bacterium]|nr:hypothetical protein [Planctomycetota bacterium]